MSASELATRTLNRNSLCILGKILDSPRPPSIRILAAHSGLSLNGVKRHLTRLRQLGLVQWDDFSCRTLVATCVFFPADSL